MNVDLDSCMTAAILIGTDGQIPDIDLAHSQALPEQLENPNIPCIECGGSGRIKENSWDHHYYGDTTEEKGYLPPACIQAAREKLGEIPMIVQAIGDWDEGKDHEFEHPEIRTIFSGMLLDVRNVMEQAKEGVALCQKWLAGDYSISPKEEKWRKMKQEYDENIENELEKIEFIDTLKGDRTIAYIESPFWGTLREAQKWIDDDDIVIVKNPDNGKITVALKPGSSADLKEVCELLNRIDPGWGGPVTGKIIGSPHRGTKLTLGDVVNVVRLFM